MSVNENNNLPDGWTLPQIGEIVYLNPRWWEEDTSNVVISFVPMAAVEAGSGRLDSSSTVEANKAKQGYTRFQEGDVLFAKITPCMENGKFAIATGLVSGKGVGSTEFHVLRPTAAVHPKLLLHFLLQEAFRKDARAKMKGAAGQLRVPPEFLAQAKIPLAPVAEQHRIVAEIEKHFTRLDAAVAALKRIKANLKRYRASVLKAACEGRLVPTEAELAKAEGRDYEPADRLLSRILKERRAKWEADQLAKMKAQGKTHKDDKWKDKYEEPVAPDTNGLSELTEGWMWARAEQLCDFITKGTTPDKRKLFSHSGQIPFIKVYNLTHHGALNFNVNPTFINEETHLGELARSRVFPGDVLMNIVGPPLGKVSIVPDAHEEWNINQAIAVFRPMPSYDRKFLSFSLLADHVLAWAERRAKATAGQFNLTLEICRDLPLPLPPHAEQQRIVAEVERHISIIEELETVVEANLTRAERLRQSILKRAFEGKLVLQDPEDEPASRLLESIKNERAARATNPKRPTARRKSAARRESIPPLFTESGADVI